MLLAGMVLTFLWLQAARWSTNFRQMNVVHFDWEYVDGQAFVPCVEDGMLENCATFTMHDSSPTPTILKQLAGDAWFETPVHVELYLHNSGAPGDPPHYRWELLHAAPRVQSLVFGTWSPSSVAPSLPEEAFQLIGGLSELRNLQFDGHCVVDRSLSHLSKLRKLLQLELNNSPITSGGLSQLQACEKIMAIYLEGTAVDDDAMDTLRLWPELNTLDLSNTAISDDFLARIGELARLRYLLTFSKIVDRPG
jgi:hypothetical protein